MLKKISIFISVCCIMCISVNVMPQGKTYKVAIKEQASSAIYATLIKAIIEAAGNNAEIQIVPAARAEYLLINRQVDIQMPQLKLYKNVNDLKFDFASISLFETAFIFYCNKNKPVDVETLKKTKGAGLTVETDPTLVDLFDVKCQATNSSESSFKKISSNRINGLIMSQFSGDTALKKTGLTDIKRQLYNSYSVTVTIPKGSNGGEVDKMLINGLNKLKASGKYDEIMGTLIKNAKYNDWQP